jgi:hypothetical protein
MDLGRDFVAVLVVAVGTADPGTQGNPKAQTRRTTFRDPLCLLLPCFLPALRQEALPTADQANESHRNRAREGGRFDPRKEQRDAGEVLRKGIIVTTPRKDAMTDERLFANRMLGGALFGAGSTAIATWAAVSHVYGLLLTAGLLLLAGALSVRVAFIGASLAMPPGKRKL